MSKFDEWNKMLYAEQQARIKPLRLDGCCRASVNSDGSTSISQLWTANDLLKLRDWITENFDN